MFADIKHQRGNTGTFPQRKLSKVSGNDVKGENGANPTVQKFQAYNAVHLRMLVRNI